VTLLNLIIFEYHYDQSAIHSELTAKFNQCIRTLHEFISLLFIYEFYSELRVLFLIWFNEREM